MNITGIEQGRATYALSCAKEGKNLKDLDKEYKAYVRKIPTLIQVNGLGATLAFVKSKSKEEKDKKGYVYKIIYKQIAEWLQYKGLLLSEKDHEEDLLEKVVELNSPTYRVVTGEVLALFKWLSRFAEGLIEGEAK